MSVFYVVVSSLNYNVLNYNLFGKVAKQAVTYH